MYCNKWKWHHRHLQQQEENKEKKKNDEDIAKELRVPVSSTVSLT